MTDIPRRAARPSQSLLSALTPALFAGAIFTSATLVFLVQPMMTKLVLPSLGGSPAVWNTALCFFQAMLLAGYSYAHALQRIASPRRQALIHFIVLITAALTLPLHLTNLLGAPSPNTPIPWLLGVLTLSVGLPFAALSATAPLLQAWYARVRAGNPDGETPYTLYVASNVGSLLALVAYPTLVEPALRLQTQTLSWSAGFGFFIVIMGVVGFIAAQAPATKAAPSAKPAQTNWAERLTWLALAAAPSSLMMGVTTYITTDVASAPFLWVAPLALYLITFIIAFQSGKALIPSGALLLIAPTAALAVVTLLPATFYFPAQLSLHLLGFFLTALACHQALAERRPEPARLTEFYLLMSAGGVIGGIFNALIAPVVFNTVAEYPLVLALICLASALQREPLTRGRAITFAIGAVAALLCLLPPQITGQGLEVKIALASVIGAAYLMRERAAMIFFVLVGVVAIVAMNMPQRETVVSSQRSFFGVLRITQSEFLRSLAHGTTLHGAQALYDLHRCEPLIYYGRATPIGQVFAGLQERRPVMAIGVVGMGAGSVAAFTREGDTLRFYEIDPLVVRAANDPAKFTYINGCAKGVVDWLVGDARLSLASERAGQYDLLLIDAFSSDAIPAHLLTVEAMKLYLDRLKPDGIVILHLSNRHLELIDPVTQVARAAGGHALVQRHFADDSNSILDSDEDAVIVARDAQALETFRADPRWTTPLASNERLWSDDYVNLFGALLKRLTGHKSVVYDGGEVVVTAPAR